MERHAESGEDKGKFADLRQRETALHRHAQRLPRKQETCGAEYGLPHNDGKGNGQYRQPIFRQHGRVDHHADGDEENGTEEILHGSRDALDALRLDRLCQNAAHHERAERAAVARLRGYHDQEEAQPHADHQQRLAVHPLPRAAQEQRHHVHAHHEPQNEEETEFEQAAHQFRALEMARHGQRTQHHHEQDAENVFEDKHAQYLAGKFLLPQPEVVEGFIDNRGGRHGQHAAEEEAVHTVPAEERTEKTAYTNHAKHDGASRYDWANAHFDDFLERKLQPEGEHQEDHADFRP